MFFGPHFIDGLRHMVALNNKAKVSAATKRAPLGDQARQAGRQENIRAAQQRRDDQDRRNAQDIEAAIAASKNPAASEFGHLGAGAPNNSLTAAELAARIHGAAEIARAGGHPLPEPTGLAKQVIFAGKKARGETYDRPEPTGLAKLILDAGKMRRGEMETPRSEPTGLAKLILDAGKMVRGEMETPRSEPTGLAKLILNAGKMRRGEL